MPIASRNPITLYFHSTVAGKETEDTGIGRIRCAVYYEIDLVFPFPNCNPEPWTCSVLSSSSLSRGESSCRWRFRFCRRWFLIIFSLLLFSPSLHLYSFVQSNCIFIIQFTYKRCRGTSVLLRSGAVVRYSFSGTALSPQLRFLLLPF